MSLRDEAIKAMRLFYVANAHDGSDEGMCTQPTAVMADEAAEFGLDGLLGWLRTGFSEPVWGIGVRSWAWLEGS